MLVSLLKNNILPRSLFGRSLLIIVTPLILLQVVSTWIFYDRHWDTITRRLSNSIAGDIAQVIELLRQSPSEDSRAAVFDMARRNFGLAISIREGVIVPADMSDNNAQIDFFLSQALKGRIERPIQIDSSAYQQRVIVDIQLQDLVMTVVVPGKRLFSTTTYIFIMWMVGTSLVLFAVASIFMRNQVRPISRLAHAADQFGKGRDLDMNFKPEGAQEVRQAAAAFNVMRERLRRQIRQRTDMLSGVSHDLRTPITRIKLQLAMLPESEAVSELTDDVAEMERMIEGYLTFARGEDNEAGQRVDLATLVRDVVAGWRRNKVNIDCHIEGTLEAWLRPDAIRRALDNLLVNARKYGQNIWVRAGRRGEAIDITVDDDGPGIPEAHREDVFRPFYRLDESRNPDTGGTGLGLAIARDLVRSHGGDITLEDSPHGGLRARIRLPL
ncbi:MAG: HAMP domain-containing protein [Rhodospirillales bacterium]|nr:MAG: HAMP domain-containing protein [Rhodospirillales bacterium]